MYRRVPAGVCRNRIPRLRNRISRHNFRAAIPGWYTVRPAASAGGGTSFQRARGAGGLRRGRLSRLPRGRSFRSRLFRGLGGDRPGPSRLATADGGLVTGFGRRLSRHGQAADSSPVTSRLRTREKPYPTGHYLSRSKTEYPAPWPRPSPTDIAVKILLARQDSKRQVTKLPPRASATRPPAHTTARNACSITPRHGCVFICGTAAVERRGDKDRR